MGNNSLIRQIFIAALLSFSLIQFSYAGTFTVNVPDSQGGYTTVVIQSYGSGFIGPRGEYYANFPSVYQLQAAYGTNQRMQNEAIERQEYQNNMAQAVQKEQMLRAQMDQSVAASQQRVNEQKQQFNQMVEKSNQAYLANQKAEQAAAQNNSQNQPKVNSTGGNIMGALFFLIVVSGILLYFGIDKYNNLVQARETVRNALNQISVLLTRRHDLIPNLVEATKGYMGYEKDTLQKVVQARQTAVNAANVPEKAQTENMLTSSLRGFWALAENYPNLKADQSVLQLQAQLTDTENKMSKARQEYNAVVKDLNVFIQSFPDSIVAAVCHFEKAPFFQGESEEAPVPQVNLKQG